MYRFYEKYEAVLYKNQRSLIFFSQHHLLNFEIDKEFFFQYKSSIWSGRLVLFHYAFFLNIMYIEKCIIFYSYNLI